MARQRHHPRYPQVKDRPGGAGKGGGYSVGGGHDLTCPVMALENWLKISSVKSGYVFRRIGQHGNVGGALDKDSIGRIVKRLARRAKLANPESYGGRSLRAGFVTKASANGATDLQIMKQTGHKSSPWSTAMRARTRRTGRPRRASWDSKRGAGGSDQTGAATQRRDLKDLRSRDRQNTRHIA